MKNRYVDLKIDWGFNYLMGRESQMRSFLNSLLSEDYGEIKSLSFENIEVFSESLDGYGVIFDLLCTTDSGDKIIVELQNCLRLSFKVQSKFYFLLLAEQALSRVQCLASRRIDITHKVGVFLLDKCFEDERRPIVVTQEFDRIKKVPFESGMRKYFIFLENFDIAKIDLLSPKDCWLEVIKNLGCNKSKISPNVYEKADLDLLELIERANVCNLSDDEYKRYEAELRASQLL